VAVPQGHFEEGFRFDPIGRRDARDDDPFRELPRQHPEALVAGAVDERLAVDVETVEEERRQRQVAAHLLDVQLATEAPHRDLERMRLAAGSKRQRLPVQDHLPCW
jgi:hypothetical protein